MNQDLRKFLLNLFWLTLVMGIAGSLFGILAPGQFVTPALPFLYPLFYGITALIYYIILKAIQDRFARFVNYYMIVTVLKLLAFIVLIVIYVLLNRTDAVPFLLTFFIFYLVYTAFEVVYFLKSVKSFKKPE